MVVEENPILARRMRGSVLESLHRGCWAVVDADGAVVVGAGDPDQLIFARSASKSLQALGPLRAGVVDRFGLTAEHLAVMISSHNGEPIHQTVVSSLLERIGLDEAALQCGAATPFAHPTATPRRLAHNCSGKHAGFLAGAVALGQDPATYLDPASPVQRAVQSAVSDLTGLDDSSWQLAVDGCSAPTFVLRLRSLGQAIARVASPDVAGLADDDQMWCRRLLAAAAAHPELVAGTSPQRFDTDLMRATNGRLFAKGGADGVQVVGVQGQSVAFVGKVDDGNDRALVPLALEVLVRLGHLDAAVADALTPWSVAAICNADGLTVGEQVLSPLPL